MEITKHLKDPLLITLDLRKFGRILWRFLEGAFVGMIIFSPVLLYGLGWIKG